jgi:hypothetical protein
MSIDGIITHIKNSDSKKNSMIFKKLRGLQGYPKPEMLHEMSVLVEELIKESGLTKKDLRKNNLMSDDPEDTAILSLGNEADYIYTLQGLSIQNRDVYMYAAAAMTAKALAEMKDLYYIEKIPIDFRDILSDKRLEKIIPDTLMERGNLSAQGDMDPYELLKNAGEQLIQGIETKMLLLNSYYERFTIKGNETEGLEKFVKEQADAISKYAKYSESVAKFLEGIQDPVPAANIKSATTMLKNPDDIITKFKTTNDYHQMRALIRGHAALVEVPEPSGLWSLIGEHTGEEISGILILQQNLLESRNITDYAKRFPKVRRAFINTGSHMITKEDNKSHNRLIKNQGEDIALALDVQKYESTNNLSYGKGVFTHLEDKILCPGLSYDTLKIIGEYLDQSINGRTIPIHKKFENKKDVYETIKSAVKNKDENYSEYISAVRELVRDTVGKSPKPLRYRFTDTVDALNTAPGISQIIYRTSTDGEGKIKRIQEITSREDDDITLKRIEKLFPDDDVYIRTNQGVAYMASSAPTIGMIYATSTLIDVRDAFSRMGEDELAKHLTRLHVDAHEIIHSAQSDSRLMWRDVATSTMEWVLNSSIILHESEQLDRTAPEWSELSHKVYWQKSWREILARIAEHNVIPALGVGEYAEKARKEGPYEAMYNIREMPPFVLDGMNIKQLRKIKMENSATARMIKQALITLRKGSIEDIINARDKLRAHSEDLVSIIEHMAEAYSLEAVKKYLKNFPDKRYGSQKLEKYCGIIDRQVKYRGELAVLYQEAMINGKTPAQRTKLLKAHGMRYVKHFNYKLEEAVEDRLIDLGYNPLDPYVAYKDMPELADRAKKANIPLVKVLTPMNGSRAMIGLRYDVDLDKYDAIIKGMGIQESFRRLLSSESSKEVYALAKDFS